MENLPPRTQLLGQFVDEYKKGLLLIPKFQRDNIWNASRKKQWSETVRGKGIIPSFIVYQIKGQGAFYLCDGYQRLCTTLEILNYPSEYGFISVDDVSAHLYTVSVCIQPTYFDSQDEAYKWFRLINSQGVTLSPSELLKGELVNDSCPLGSRAFEEAEEWIRPSLFNVCNGKKKGENIRIYGNRRKRAAFALFYQFTSQSKTSSFWDYADKEVKEGGIALETLLAGLLNTMTPSQMDDAVSAFTRHIENYTAVIRTFVDEITPKSPISPGLYYHLMHFTIYAKNNNIRAAKVLEVLKFLLRNSQRFTARINYSSGDELFSITLATDTLTNLWKVLERNGIELERPNRNRKAALMPGYDQSHKLPFAHYGENETIPEPSVINRSRGANPI